MKKDTEQQGSPDEQQYKMMRAMFSEVLRLEAIGSKAELKGKPASKNKEELLSRSMTAMAFVGSFLNGVDKEWKEEQENK